MSKYTFRFWTRTLLAGVGTLLLLSSTVCFGISQRNESVIAPGCNKFGVELLKRISKSQPGKNVLISSYSISEALNMTASGAAGATAQEVYDIVDGSKLSAKDVNAASKQLRDSLSKSGTTDKKVDIVIANSLWVTNKVKLKQSFVDGCKSDFNAMVKNVSVPAAADAINGWVEQATKGKIKRLINELSPEMAAVLVNAVYFKGLWLNSFKKELTTDQRFYRSKGNSKNVKLMSNTGKFLYYASKDAQMIALPYRQGRMRMLIVLPSEKIDADTFLVSLTLDRLSEMRRSLYSHSVGLHLPKFKIEFGTYSVAASLQDMGIRKLFFGGDFSKAVEPESQLALSDVLHKAIVEVDEEGTVATAATAAVLMVTGTLKKTEPIVMRVDRPFLVFIEDSESGMILFSGIVNDPQV